MEKKVIRLKESQIVDMVNKIVSEQIGSEDNALAAIKPPKNNVIKAAMARPQPMSPGNENIINHKNMVRSTLKKLMFSLNGLIQASGINPETNNLTSDIQKVSDKFEQLFGDPTPESMEGE